MNYFLIRQDLHLVIQQTGQRAYAIDAFSNTYYMLVLCDDCMNWPELIEPKMVFAHILRKHPDKSEYASAVSRMLQRLMIYDPDEVVITLDDGKPVVVYERISEKAIKNMPKGTTPYVKNTMMQIYLTDNDFDL